ncbi:MAG TPA: hypothetical protein VGD00_02340 [Solirubrobacteraceae bacterium]
MTTRTIVTSQPDVACDVCSRRLLRGELSDVFLVAGRRRTVCELCAPRAVHEGWQRESEHTSLTLPPMRPRRGRGLFQRLLLLARPDGEQEAPPSSRAARSARARARRADRAEPYEALDASGERAFEPALEEPSAAHTEAPHEDAAAPLDAAAAPGDHLQQAVEIFNASEFPRRVAGVARSLGPPAISVRTAEHLASAVRIAVAWELCWYRYEVDLSEDEPAARSLNQGTELSELDREELEANAQADDAGAIQLLA